MIACASLIPVAEWFPFSAVLPWTKNIAFGCENKIRTNWYRKLGETFLEQIDRAPRIDRPDRAAVLQLANQFHTLRVEQRFASTRNKCSVKIDTEQFNR